MEYKHKFKPGDKVVYILDDAPSEADCAVLDTTVSVVQRQVGYHENMIHLVPGRVYTVSTAMHKKVGHFKLEEVDCYVREQWFELAGEKAVADDNPFKLPLGHVLKSGGTIKVAGYWLSPNGSIDPVYGIASATNSSILHVDVAAIHAVEGVV